MPPMPPVDAELEDELDELDDEELELCDDDAEEELVDEAPSPPVPLVCEQSHSP